MSGKAKALAVIAELQRLVPSLTEAVQEEREAAVAEAQEAQALKDATAEEDAGPPIPSPEPTASDTAAPSNGHANSADSAVSDAVGDAVERMVQLAYFTQVQPCACCVLPISSCRH